jgi:hypothetical protein
MDIQARITPLIASLENTLGECINVLKNGGDVVQVMSALNTVQQALSKLRPVIDGLADIENEQSLALFGIQDAAIELLLSLDTTHPEYKPRPHAENVELIYSLFECLPDAPPPDNVVNMPVKKEVN